MIRGKGTKVNQFDSPWKEALEKYLRSTLEFCFPSIAKAIDWRVPVQFLDQELREIVRDAALGQQRVDKLVRVTLRNGKTEVILIHIEVQHRPDPNLAERVFQYNRRCKERFGTPVLTLVILADASPSFRPDCYEETVLDCCRIRFDFPTCKLLDLVKQAQEQIEVRRPSAVLIVANWLAQRTQADMRRRLREKWNLTRRLYEAGYRREDILELYRLIDWLLSLPPDLSRRFKRQVVKYEAKKHMPYVTSIERLAKEEGWAEGRQEGRQEGQLAALRDSVLETLEVRFGTMPRPLKMAVLEISNPVRLKRLHRLAVTCGSMADFRRQVTK